MQRAQDRAWSAKSRKNGARSATMEYHGARSATIKSRALGALKLASEARDENVPAKRADFLIFVYCTRRVESSLWNNLSWIRIFWLRCRSSTSLNGINHWEFSKTYYCSKLNFRFSVFFNKIQEIFCRKRNASTPLGNEPRTFRFPVEC